MRTLYWVFASVVLLVTGFIVFGSLTSSNETTVSHHNDQIALALTAISDKEKLVERLLAESEQIKSLSTELASSRQTLTDERKRKDELLVELQSLKQEVRKMVGDFRELMKDASALINQQATNNNKKQQQRQDRQQQEEQQHQQHLQQHLQQHQQQEQQRQKEEVRDASQFFSDAIIKTTAKLHDEKTCFKHNLIILSKQRSGTHFLKSLIDQHPLSKSNNELFRTPRIENSYFNETWHKQSHNFTVAQTKEYIQRLMKASRTNSFVLQANHLELYPQVVPVVKELDYYAIHLYRRNVLKMLISQAVDEISNQAICIQGRECAGRSTVIRLDTSRLVSSITRWIAQQELNRITLKQHNMRWIEVNYDQLTSNHTIACDVLQFMGCKCFPFAEDGVTTQINIRKNEDIVENYDEVIKTLTGTSYEYLLTLD